ncbi:hypothetical protein [Spirosoma montaniterrae]|nr:hypothetical protein [Spirosoma montaniterrae]
METVKDHPVAIVPNRVLKGKDGREPFAEKLAKVNEILKKAGLPEELKKK